MLPNKITLIQSELEKNKNDWLSIVKVFHLKIKIEKSKLQKESYG